MFNHIAGTLDSKTPSAVVIDAGGVGYLLRVPLSTSGALPGVGQRAKVLTYMHVSQDAVTLFGFATDAERDFFLQLLSVNGVGPKLALAVLSGGRVQDIQQAIRLGDFKSLTRIKGVGETTAKKIVLELGKILIHQTSAAAGPATTAAAKGARGAVAPGLDQDTDMAVKAVMQLQEVPADVALQAVQRAYAELAAVSSEKPVIQAVVQRAMRYTG